MVQVISNMLTTIILRQSSIAGKCLRTMSSLFSPNLIDQCGILLTQARARPILHDDWSIRLGENRPGRVLKQLAGMLDNPVYILSAGLVTDPFTISYRVRAIARYRIDDRIQITVH